MSKDELVEEVILRPGSPEVTEIVTSLDGIGTTQTAADFVTAAVIACFLTGMDEEQFLEFVGDAYKEITPALRSAIDGVLGSEGSAA